MPVIFEQHFDKLCPKKTKKQKNSKCLFMLWLTLFQSPKFQKQP